MTLPQPIDFGPFRVDLSREQLLHDGEPVHLRPKSWQVLRYLAERPGLLITQNELLDAVWPETAVVPQVLTNVMGELRRTLGDRYVETLRGKGFRLAVDASPPSDDEPAGHEVGFVGRDEELAVLRKLFSNARQGSRKLALVSGPAGIGKTSLVEVFLRSISHRQAGARVLRGGCISGHGQAEPFFPMLSALGALLRSGESGRVLEPLRRFVPGWLQLIPGAGTSDEGGVAAGVPATPAQVLRGAAMLLEDLAGTEPLVVVLEDLQWVDASTLDLVTLLAERTEAAKLLVIGTYRSADALVYNAPVLGVARRLRHRGRALELALAPLSAASLREYLDRRFGHEVGEVAAAAALEHSGGTPLFLRLAADHYVERSWIERTPTGWRLAAGATIRGSDLPDDLGDLIAHQYRALREPEAAVVRVASLCGEEFGDSTIAQVLGAPNAEVARICGELADRAQLLARGPGGPDGDGARFRFRHAVHRQIIQEIVQSEAQDLHRKLAEALELGGGGGAEATSSQIAFHFRAAGDSVRAARHFERAAFTASSQGAYREAVASLDAALEELGRLSEGAAPDKERRLHLTLAFLLLVVDGYASQRALTALRRVEELSDAESGDPLLFQALIAIAVVRWNAGQVAPALADAERAAQLARDRHPKRIASADAICGFALTTAGEFDAARCRLDAALTSEHSLASALFNLESTTRMVKAMVSSAQGRLREARHTRERVRSLADATGTPLERMFVALFGAAGSAVERDAKAALDFARDGEALDAEYGIASLGGGIQLLAEWARLYSSDPNEDTATLRGLLEQRLERGERWAADAVFGLLADLELRRGNLSAAQADVDAGLAECQSSGQGIGRVDLICAQARIHAASGRGEEAETCFHQALEAARAQGAGLYGLRAATAFARWLLDLGRVEESRRLVEGALTTLPERGDSEDERDAGALLEALPIGE